MLTWRPWEFVTGIAGMNDTAYYKMLKRIVDAVPEELKDKLVVMPHPLIVEQVKRNKDDVVLGSILRTAGNMMICLKRPNCSSQTTHQFLF